MAAVEGPPDGPVPLERSRETGLDQRTRDHPRIPRGRLRPGTPDGPGEEPRVLSLTTGTTLAQDETRTRPSYPQRTGVLNLHRRPSTPGVHPRTGCLPRRRVGTNPCLGAPSTDPTHTRGPSPRGCRGPSRDHTGDPVAPRPEESVLTGTTLTVPGGHGGCVPGGPTGVLRQGPTLLPGPTPTPGPLNVVPPRPHSARPLTRGRGTGSLGGTGSAERGVKERPVLTMAVVRRSRHLVR